jgi:hypothetical protein
MDQYVTKEVLKSKIKNEFKRFLSGNWAKTATI